MQYIKSPLNYIGNKFQILPQLMQIFPKNIDTFYDYFCGGCDVSTNIQANQIIAIDVNTFTIDILKEFQIKSLEEILAFIEKRINEFQLSKTNEKGFLDYREAYNTNKDYHTPLDLFTLSRYSFHFTMRFTQDLKMNAGFGRGYSNFSSRQRRNIGPFYESLQKVQLINDDFRYINPEIKTDNFFYFDPPYLITNNVYNHGADKANQKWTEYDEIDLLKYIDNINKQGGRFALSNVIQHRNKVNTILEKWLNNNHFNIYEITNEGYSHCTHTVYQDGAITKEIVVTNYK